MQQRAAETRLLSRQAARKRKLVEAGIVYNFDKVGYVSFPVRYGSIIAQKPFCSHRKNLKARHDDLCQPCTWVLRWLRDCIMSFMATGTIDIQGIYCPLLYLTLNLESCLCRAVISGVCL